jgi:hypothetical protein
MGEKMSTDLTEDIPANIFPSRKPLFVYKKRKKRRKKLGEESENKEEEE